MEWLLAQADPFSLVEFGKLVVQVGLTGSLVLYFVWEASKREDRMQKRCEILENFIREDLVQLNRECVKALQNDALQTEKASRASDGLTMTLNTLIQQRRNE